MPTEPVYLETFASGGLKEKLEKALDMLSSCRMCPRNCGVNRMKDERGACGIGRNAVVCSCFAHFGEESVLTGRHGSGTIFFGGCNLRCIFCQNWETSRVLEGTPAGAGEIASMMLELQNRGCHNINLVTPSHVGTQVLEALPAAIEKGLNIPIVYNTGGYDALRTLEVMEGIIDIYMPDFKFFSSELSGKYLNAPDYPQRARAAIKEMHRQVGDLDMDSGTQTADTLRVAAGTSGPVRDRTAPARRGLLIRHLVMPGFVRDSERIFKWVAGSVSKNTYINIMGQYHPAGDVISTQSFPELRRLPTVHELDEAFESARAHGLRRFD